MKLFRKITALFLIIELIAASFTVSLAENETVSIASEAELIAFAASVNAGNTVNAVLTDDIVLSNAAITIAPAERTSFKGEFDGNGHTITFTNAINTVYSGSTFSALFGYIASSGTVKDLNLGGSVQSAESVSLLAYSNAGTIDGVTASVTAASAKLLSAFVYTNSGTIENSQNLGRLTTQYGEIFGFAFENSGIIRNSQNSGEIAGAEFGDQQIFALTASAFVKNNNAAGSIINCINSADISGGQNLSGFAAANKGTIDGCVNAGDVTAYSQYAAGITNTNTGAVRNCENSGNISANANYSAGIANKSSGTSGISSCLNFGSITGDSQVAGIVSESYAQLSDCRNYGDTVNLATDAANTRKKYYAGIAGYASANVTSCVNYGTINGGVMYTGGIVGYANGTFSITSCANYGEINGFAHRVGGIAGHVQTIGTAISECASYADVNGATSGTGNFCGALVGYSAGTITDCIAEGTVTGINTSGGFVARNYASGNNVITNSVMLAAPCRLAANNVATGFADIYVNTACTGGTVMTGTEFENGTVTALLNTKNNTVADRDIFATENGRIVIKSIPTEIEEKQNITKPAADPAAAVNIMIPSDRNAGISCDIYAVFLSPYAYLFLPATFSGDTVEYTVVNAAGVPVSYDSVTIGADNTAVLESGTYTVRAMRSTLPTFYMNIDETYGTVAKMNTSEKHTDYCYGDFSLDVPEALALSRGWNTHYQSTENNAEAPGTMSVRGRGNSSWKIQTNKKPSYQVKSEKKVDLLKMGSSKKWVLVAGDNDLFKNKFGLDLGKEMGISYTNESEFVDLYVNGTYMGVYMLSEKVEIASTRINITDMDEVIEAAGAENIDSIDMTGGYLLEIDNAAEAEESFKIQGNAISVKSPEDLDTKVLATNRYKYIVDLMSDVFNTVYDSEDLTMPDGTSLLEHIDIESFARYFWHQEFIGNTDCGRGSTYFYKDTDSIDSLIYAGPIWDSDALSYYYRTNSWWMPQSTYSASDPSSAPSFYRKLIEHKEFVSYLLWYYEYSNIKEAMAKAPELISSYQEQLSVPGYMNSLRWNNGAAFNRANYLNNYITTAVTRASWIDANYTGLADLATKGSLIELAPPPEPRGYTMARLYLSGGTAKTEIGESDGYSYPTFTGIKALGTTVKGSVTGSAPCRIEYSDSAYTLGDASVSVPVIAAGNENQWGDTPYFEITTNTLLYNNLTFSAKLGGSKKGVKSFALSYSTDGTSFTQLGTYSIKANKKMEQAFENVALPQDAENQALLIIRIEATDRATIGGSTTDLSPTGGETAIDDIVLSGETDAEIEIFEPTANKASGMIAAEQAITLSTNTPDGQVFYTLSDGETVTDAALYRSAIVPFEILPAQQLTLCAWTDFDGDESEKVYYTYQNGGVTIAGFKNSDWTSASTGKIYATSGIYRGAYLSASLDGVSVYPPLKDGKGFALAPDDGEKWRQNGGWYFEIPMAGFSNIRMTMDAASSNKGPKSLCLEYSTDGVSFTEIETDRALPVTNMACYYDFYPIPAAGAEKLYVKLSMRENSQASGATPLFNNLSKGNSYIDNIIFTGTKTAPLMPYIAKETDKFGADEALCIISPENLPVKYSIASGDGPVITDAAYTGPIDLSGYAVSGNSVSVSAYCEGDGVTSATFTKTYTFEGTTVAEFNFLDASHVKGTYATATYGTGKISCRPDGATAQTLTYDTKYGLQAQANADLYWIYPDAEWLIELSTKGYESLSISLDQRSGGSGPRDYAMSYSLDGVSFTKLPSSRVRVNSVLNPTYVCFDLPPEISDKETVYISISLDGKENVDGDELTDPAVIGKGKTSINHIVIHGAKLPGMIRNVANGGTSATIVNVTGNAISAAIVRAIYKDGKLIDSQIENIAGLAAGAQTNVTFPLYAGDFDEIKIMALDSLSGMKPLCETYVTD